MTTPLTTRLTTVPTTLPTTRRTTPFDDLAGALDTLAAAAEQTRDDAPGRAVLAVVVQRLEDAAGAWLGDTDDDALVVLQRRFGRAHARLARDRTGGVDADLLHGLAQALRPAAVGGTRPRLQPASTAVLAGC